MTSAPRASEVPPLSARLFSLYGALDRKHQRRKSGLCVAEGRRIVSDLLTAGRPLDALVVADPADPLILEARVRGVSVYRAEPRQWKVLTSTETPQGVLAVLPCPETPLPDVLAGEAPVLVLDRVRDPGNVGALARTAAGLGVGLVLGPETVEHGNPKVVRASAGAVLLRPPAVAADAETLLAAIRASGRGLVAAVPSGGVAPAEVARRYPRACLLLGGEAEGPGRGLLDAADARVSIPMAGIDSLNVAAAGAILLWELVRDH